MDPMKTYSQSPVQRDAGGPWPDRRTIGGERDAPGNWWRHMLFIVTRPTKKKPELEKIQDELRR